MNFFDLSVNKANVSYFLIVQDILGVLIVLLGLKLSIVYFLYIIRQGEKIKNAICLIGSIILMFSGINLIYFKNGLQTWIVSVAFIMIGSLLGRFAYSKL